MGPDPRQRARFLVEDVRIAEIPLHDAFWLQSHVADCTECALYAEELEEVVRGVKAFAFDLDPAMTGRIQNALAARVGKPWLARSWARPRALAAALFLIVAAVPLYKGVRDARREKDDALLMERVESRVWRAVPLAMEPLIQSQSEESK